MGCLAGLAILQPAVEAIFLGPIAVGAVIGALAVGKGFLLGSLLSRKRSRKQSYRYTGSIVGIIMKLTPFTVGPVAAMYRIRSSTITNLSLHTINTIPNKLL